MLDGQEGRDTKVRFIADRPDKITVLAVYPPLTIKEKVTCAGSCSLQRMRTKEYNLCFLSKAPLAVDSSS